MSKINKLVNRLKNGDEEAFDLIYEEYKNLVYYCVINILHDSHLSEEITQDTFIRMYKNIDKYESGTNFKAWLVRIGKNLAINEYKKRKIDIEFNEKQIHNCTIKDNKTFEFINELKQYLSDDECEVITLYFVYDLNNREISEMLNKPLGTILWLRKNALSKLKKNLKKEE